MQQSSSPGTTKRRAAPSVAAVVLSLCAAGIAMLVGSLIARGLAYLTAALLRQLNLPTGIEAAIALLISSAPLVLGLWALSRIGREMDDWPGALIYEFPVFVLMVSASRSSAFASVLDPATATAYGTYSSWLLFAFVALIAVAVALWYRRSRRAHA